MMPNLITRTHFENALTDVSLRTTRIIQLALAAGPLFFLGTVLFVTFTQSDSSLPTPDEISTVNLLTIVHLAYAAIAPFLGSVLFSRTFAPGRLTPDGTPGVEQIATQCVALQRTAILVRLAVLEGASFFGLVVCMLGAINGILRLEPEYWINAASTGVLVMVAVLTFPTRERLVTWFQERFPPAS